MVRNTLCRAWRGSNVRRPALQRAALANQCRNNGVARIEARLLYVASYGNREANQRPAIGISHIMAALAAVDILDSLPAGIRRTARASACEGAVLKASGRRR